MRRLIVMGTCLGLLAPLAACGGEYRASESTRAAQPQSVTRAASDDQPKVRPNPTPTEPDPAAPAGSGYVAVGDVAVAVPVSWSERNDISCFGQHENLPGHVIASPRPCQVPVEDYAFLQILDMESREGRRLADAFVVPGKINKVEVLRLENHHAPLCTLSIPGTCSDAIAVPSEGVIINVVQAGRYDHIDQILGSVTHRTH
jgi:hypothetical protein